MGSTTNSMNSFLTVTQEGKVYACGEATNGRLGLGMSTGTVSVPRQLTALSQYVIKKVAVHSGRCRVEFRSTFPNSTFACWLILFFGKEKLGFIDTLVVMWA